MNMFEALFKPAIWLERQLKRWFPDWLVDSIMIVVLTFTWMLPWTIIWSFVTFNPFWLLGFWGRLTTVATAIFWIFCYIGMSNKR